ncbi:YgaP family membrane protein [Halegenticoccus tardaugens]|uniref:YgaP family membrane protein n=1 Tax=Halegenticoccus tardaugens TaxID=2071624 RepID=UPI00100B1403|nr:DUF2892 domain-containing protein [Halegenticoccus tardaugens]
MKKNVGGYDRIARFVVGPILLVGGAAAFAGALTLATGAVGAILAAVALVAGAVLIATAITQKCPLNRALGVDTYRGPAATDDSIDDERGAGRPS